GDGVGGGAAIYTAAAAAVVVGIVGGGAQGEAGKAEGVGEDARHRVFARARRANQAEEHGERGASGEGATQCDCAQRAPLDKSSRSFIELRRTCPSCSCASPSTRPRW